MPEGVEKDLTPQALADLIAFLGAWGSGPEPQVRRFMRES